MSFKRRIGKIKVDFFNMRVEFSPNIEIVSKKSQSITGGDEPEEVVISFEVMNNISPSTKPEYKAYVLSEDELQDDEPFDLDDPWYKLEGMELEIVKQEALPDSGGASGTPSQPAAPASTAPAPPSPTTTPAASSKDSAKVAQLEKQLDSLKNMITSLDQNFQDGKISQEEYLKKKNFLAEKMGTLMGQIDALKG